jgi:hypothetical protein
MPVKLHCPEQHGGCPTMPQAPPDATHGVAHLLLTQLAEQHSSSPLHDFVSAVQLVAAQRLSTQLPVQHDRPTRHEFPLAVQPGLAQVPW